MPRIVTRSVIARRAKAMRLNWRTVVMDTQGWRQSNSAKMSGMGFCSSCVGVVVGATQQLYYKSPFPSHFGEGIGITYQNVTPNLGIIIVKTDITYQPLHYVDLTEQTYRALKDKILRDELKAGTQISVP